MKKVFKWIGIIFLSFIVIGIIGTCFSDSDNKVNLDEGKEDALQSNKTGNYYEKLLEYPDSLVGKINGFISFLEDTEKSIPNIKDAKELALTIGLLQPSKALVKAAEKSEDVSVKKALNKYREASSKAQVKNFPKIREKQKEILRNIMWEHDIEVSISGKKKEILTFTGVMFAKNKNIKEFHQNIAESVRLSRVKEVHYKWTKYDDEHSYYEIKSPPDSELLLD